MREETKVVLINSCGRQSEIMAGLYQLGSLDFMNSCAFHRYSVLSSVLIQKFTVFII